MIEERDKSEPVFQVRLGEAQHLGSRKDQEDAVEYSNILDVQFIQHGGVVGIIADGMGGYENGQDASRAAVTTFLETYKEKTEDEPIRDAILRSLFAANDAVLSLPKPADTSQRIGTTFTAAVVHKHHLYWVSVGDSRLYLIRGGHVIQLSSDHVFAVELDRQVKQNMIPQHVAEIHPERDILTSYVGREDLSLIDYNMRPFELEDGDRLILCSDGLYRTLPSSEFAELMTTSPQESAKLLIRETIAKHQPAQDNASALVIAIDTPGNELEYTSATELKSLGTLYRSLGGLFVLLAIAGLAALLAHRSPPAITEPTSIQRNADDPSAQKPKPTRKHESRRTESRPTEPKPVEEKLTDQRPADSKPAQQKAAELNSAEPKNAEAKNAELKDTSQKNTGQKNTGQKNTEQKNGPPKIAPQTSADPAPADEPKLTGETPTVSKTAELTPGEKKAPPQKAAPRKGANGTKDVESKSAKPKTAEQRIPEQTAAGDEPAETKSTETSTDSLPPSADQPPRVDRSSAEQSAAQAPETQPAAPQPVEPKLLEPQSDVP